MKIYELILSLFYRIVKDDKRFKYYKKLQSNLRLSRNEILEEQNINIQKLIDHAYNQTEYYRELMDLHQITPEDIKTKEDLMKLPILTKQLIKDNINKIISKDRFSHNMAKVMSGGSTGELGIVYKSQFFEQMSRASWLRNNSMIGWMPSDKSVWIWGSPIGQHTSIITKLGIIINRRIIFNAFNYSITDFPKWYSKMLKFKPKVVFGYSNILLEFSKFLIEKKINLPSVKMVVSTSEKLKNYNIIEKAFNCPVHDQYGCREVVAIGIELSTNEMVFTDDVVIVNTNKTNEFLLTPLFSFGFPLINYRVGDIGEIQNENNINNKYPFPIMSLRIGRTSDYFLRENNQIISCSNFSSDLDALSLGIKEHQIIQVNYKNFKINFISLKNTDKENYYKIVTSRLEEYFGENLTIEFNNVVKISVEKSGKLLLYKRIFNLEN